MRTRKVNNSAVNCMAPWTNAEVDFLRTNARQMAVADMAKRLGRSDRSVRNKAFNLGISMASVRRTDEDMEEVYRMIDSCKTKAEAARKLGMDPTNLYELIGRRPRKDGK